MKNFLKPCVDVLNIKYLLLIHMFDKISHLTAKTTLKAVDDQFSQGLLSKLKVYITGLEFNHPVLERISIYKHPWIWDLGFRSE